MVAIWQVAQENGEAVRQRVIDRYGFFSVDKAAELYDLEVSYVEDLPDNAYGLIVKTVDCSRPNVYINKNIPRETQRFTLAHEIGHYIERMIEADDMEYSFSDEMDRKKYDMHEFYADQFALGMLMPEAEVREETPGLNNFVVLMSRFRVTREVAEMRLSRLKKQELLNSRLF